MRMNKVYHFMALSSHKKPIFVKPALREEKGENTFMLMMHITANKLAGLLTIDKIHSHNVRI